MISSPDHAHKIPLTTQSCDSQLFDTPVMHVQDNIHVPFHGSKKKLDPAQGTWKRLRPPPVGSKIKPEDKAIESFGQTNHLPWLCIGDFNEITNQSEKAGGCLRPTRQMDRIRTAIHHCHFIALGYVGSPFTWSRNHPVEGRIHIKLDRALANMTWKALFPNAIVHHVSMSSSVQTTPCSPSRYSPPDLNNHDPDLSSVLRPCGFKTHDAPISSKKRGTKVFLSQVVLQSPTVMLVAVTD